MDSRERMLTAISGGRPDRVPLSFMIFRALARRTNGWRGFLEAAIDMGLDACVDLAQVHPDEPAEHSDAQGVPLHFGPEVSTREWRQPPTEGGYPILHKQYLTPAGTLSVAVKQTDDWPYGDHVPFLDDYVEPRAVTFPVTGPDDLPALRHLLTEPTGETIARCREAWAAPKAFAADRGLLLVGGWGVGADAAAWLVGLTNAVLAAHDRPEFLQAFLDVVGAWNRRRMEIVLDQGVDLLVRRGWYEGTSFWSPGLYRRFLLPHVQAEAALAHQAGAKFGYIMTVGALQFADLLAEAGVDVVLGVEDVQDHGMDLPAMKSAAAGRFALWGGVNGFVTLERGRDEEIRAAAVRAMEALGPEGFILSPVDNVRDASEEVWRKVQVFVDAWKARATAGR
jgi:hypothetical protein